MIDVDFDFDVPGVAHSLFMHGPSAGPLSPVIPRLLTLPLGSDNMSSLVLRIPVEAPHWARLNPTLYLRMTQVSEVLEQIYAAVHVHQATKGVNPVQSSTSEELKLTTVASLDPATVGSMDAPFSI